MVCADLRSCGAGRERARSGRSHTVMIGRTIGKYRIVGQLGRGGAGIVYRAVDETLTRDVAIKTLNPGLADTEIMKRFRAEATILAKLNHPQIATIYELYRSDTDLLMVMEFVRGETLDHLATRLGPTTAPQAVYLIDQILSALEHAHRAGVVHRDMKPANVMVTPAGGIKIMDFGIARVRGAEQMTVDGRMMGTPAYMPPEQVLGQEVDGRADLYSVGVVLYRLLAGALPFTSDTAIGMLQRQILEMPMSLRAHRPELPEWVDTIVQRSLAKSPADRFQTAEEFREALAAAAGSFATVDIAKTLAVAEPPDALESREDTATHTLVLPPVDSSIAPRRFEFTWLHGALVVLTLTAAALAVIALRQPAVEPIIVTVPERATAPTLPAPDAARRVGADPVVPAVAAAQRRTSTTKTPARRQPEAPPLAARPVSAAMPVPPPPPPAAPLMFEAKALVGSKGKYKERDAQMALADGRITVTTDDDKRDELYSVPYESVLSIAYSRGRDPMWKSPQGPAPVARAGGTLGRMGIFVGREWISMRTNTRHQFVALRFDDVLVKRVLLALEERTGRTPQFIEERKEGR
jgi:serine/threonine-protein kinase